LLPKTAPSSPADAQAHPDLPLSGNTLDKLLDRKGVRGRAGARIGVAGLWEAEWHRNFQCAGVLCAGLQRIVDGGARLARDEGQPTEGKE
jgi:hypothetical protein